MSEKEQKSWLKKLLFGAIIAVFISNGGTALWQSTVVQADTNRNTEAIYELQKDYVRKDINNREHHQIMATINNNEVMTTSRIDALSEKMDKTQFFIIDKIDKGNADLTRIILNSK